ncbi:MAG: rRNA pseudouridine synthase [Clostridia bacterium]|nr:rRNA pseudouridine synthase [Clostridia bacterium]
MTSNQLSRIDKLLGLTGIGRSEAKKLIAAGRVAVSGVVVRDSGFKALSSDLTVDGSPILVETDVYLMLHKPAGVVTATEDKRLPTVVSLLPEKYQRRKIGPVGRLDRDVTGLVLLTTDGELAHRLISPKWKAEKTYRATCEGRLAESDVAAFASGLELSDFTAKPAKLDILTASDEESLADVTLTEGKFHQVKRMFIAVGHPLSSLHRLRIGCVTLDDSLAPGEFRALTGEEILGLKRLTNLDKE